MLTWVNIKTLHTHHNQLVAGSQASSSLPQPVHADYSILSILIANKQAASYAGYWASSCVLHT